MATQLFRIVPLALALLAGCAFQADPDADRFACENDTDCGDGQVCKRQMATGKGICFDPASCTEEVCDGLDNDCDGAIDEEVPGVGEVCETGEVGACQFGRTECREGALVCTGAAPAAEELCNGEDDDCDGEVDEGFDLSSDPQNCGACGTVCAPGAACVESRCVEVDCGNGVDDDGNEQTDCADSACDASDCGPHGRICAAGACSCSGGEEIEASCGDGIDNDCDGLIDCADPDCEGLRCQLDGADGTCVAGMCE